MSSSPELSQNISKTIQVVLTDLAEFAYLMGSAETERYNEESDIDIAVFWKETSTDEQKKQCLADLEKTFSRDVDLVSLNKIDVIFAHQVLQKGRLIFDNNLGLHLKWKMEKLSEYPDFKISRKVIEDNILQRKKYV